MRPTDPLHPPRRRGPHIPRNRTGTNTARFGAAAALVPALLVPSVLVTSASAAPSTSATEAVAASAPYTPADGGAPAADTGATLSPIPGQGPPTDPVYRLAGGCYTLETPADGAHPGGFVARSGGGYALASDPADAERFRTKAAQLGRFLLYGTDATMLTEADQSGLPAAGLRRDLAGAVGDNPVSDAVIAAPNATPGADWRVDFADGAYGLTGTVSGRPLTIDADGTLEVGSPGSGSADATRFRLAAAEGCATFPEAEVNADGPPHTGTDADGNVVGYADPHMHMATDGYIGGRVHCGRSASPLGVTVALADCPDHKPDGVPALLQNIISESTPIATHDTTGWPTFAGYPKAHSLTHEQDYYRWVERSWRGGQRIMSDLLVTNDVLCKIYWLGDTPCNGMDVARLQMRELRAMQDYVDAQYGGPGRGWFRIVEDPAAARAVIESGRLAVVPGIEISDIAGCSLSGGTPDCTRADIDAALDELEAMGVRQVILVHKFDNALGGTRMDSDFNGLAVNIGNFLATGHFWQVEPCTGPASDNEQPLTAPGAQDVAGILPPGVTLPVYPDGPVCNARGLTDLGRHAVHAAMDRGMIIDIDHMGVKTADETLDILEGAGYHRVLSSHSWTDPTNYRRVLALGGFVSLMANGEDDYADRWRELRSEVPDGRFFGIGYADDANGFAAQVPPPGEDGYTGPPVEYPFTTPDGTVMHRQRTGDRVFDFNTDGIAEYGLYPDWIEHERLRAEADDSDGGQLIEDMNHGAEAYLRMWEGR